MKFLNYNIINKLIIFPIIFLSIFFLYNLKDFKLDASSDSLILQNDKTFKFFNYYNEIFPSRNFLVLAIESEKIIDDNYIKNLNKLKNKLISIPGIESILSLVDLPILFSNNLSLKDLNAENIENINNTKFSLNKILEEFSKNPIFVDQMINKNKTVSSMIIYLDENKEFNKLKQLYNSIDKNDLNFQKTKNAYRETKDLFVKSRHNLIVNIRNNLKEENNNYVFFLGGIDMIADDTLQFIKKDIIIFSICVLLFIFAVLYLIFKSIKWVLIPIISSIFSILCAVGLISLLKWEVTAISSNFISLMLILSISMNIHIINNYRINFDNHKPIEKLKITLNKMFWPCFYTALTTIVAFGSLLFSDIKPVIDFGKIMILGLIIILISSFTILPYLISMFPNIKENKFREFRILDIFFHFSIKHKYKIYLVNFIFFILSIFGIYNLNVENSFINYFKKDTEIYKGMKLIDQELGGTTPIDIILKFNDEQINNDDLKSKDNNEDLEFDDIDLEDSLFHENENHIFFTDDKIETIKSIHNYLEKRTEIGKVQSIYSLINIAELINRNELTSFELSVLYNEIPENFKKDLINPYLSIDNNMAKITARIRDSENIEREKIINDINFYISNNYSNIEESNVNGLLVLYNNMLQSLFTSQIKSFGIVLISIFFMFLILFRSLKLSIIGIIPNIFASTFILGFIGLSGIPLDIMTITIAAITIGIAVDNTIHYLYKTKNNLNNKINIKESLNDSHKTVGQAVLTTSLTIAFGFSVLCLSNFIPTILFGLFTAIAMIIAMLGVLITLPSALIKINYEHN